MSEFLHDYAYTVWRHGECIAWFKSEEDKELFETTLDETGAYPQDCVDHMNNR